MITDKTILLEKTIELNKVQQKRRTDPRLIGNLLVI